jgi:chemotaxis protein MotB
MARNRRKNPLLEDDGHSHERWLISYADFVTLLFAFFVVMYSISSVNNAKYDALSESLEEAFSKPKVVEKVVVEKQVDNKSTVDKIELEDSVSDSVSEEVRILQMVSEQLKNVLQSHIKADLVEVKQNEFWIELEMNKELVFLSGQADLSSKAGTKLKKITDVVEGLPNVINIEGHTDNVPIGTLMFPSNWELSSARATAVVREFIKYGVSSERLSATGYGEFHPVASNLYVEGRKKNRRVVLVLMSQMLSRYGVDDRERAKLLNLKREDDAS